MKMNWKNSMFASLAAVVLLATGCGGATADTVTLSREVLLDKIKGGWAGQTFGCTYGGPTEFKYNGTIIPDEYEIRGPTTISNGGTTTSPACTTTSTWI